MAFNEIKRLLLTIYLIIVFERVEGKVKFNISEPQIAFDDGHMLLVPGQNKNLILVGNGTGKIIFNDIDLNTIIESLRNSSRDIGSLRRNFSLGGVGGIGTSRRLRRLEEKIVKVDEIGPLDERLTNLERQFSGVNSTDSINLDATSGNSSSGTVSSRALRRRVTTLERRMRELRTLNPCSSNPCLNSGTCIPTLFGPFCYCPSGWEGSRCEQDVNECNNFAGTGLGCQNGAQCLNTPGSYQCQCRSGWVGIHCTLRSGDCSSGPVWELCGHGMCINQHTGSRPYSCICEQGWKTDGTNPACTVDVDECNGPHAACSKNPPVVCLNTPGSYHCGPCPIGYTGNGYQCTDIDECLINNGGCSLNPYVQCINTIGSRTCGECPPGYIGNGQMCQYVGVCQVNNGGCHPMARCIHNPALGQSYVQCICPSGWNGPGLGLSGCFPSNNNFDINPSPNLCSPNPCSHGTCIPSGNNFMCICPSGYTGLRCENVIDPCGSSPCSNGGTCYQNGLGFRCACRDGFTGMRCEVQEQECGGLLNGLEGTFSYPLGSNENYRHNANCLWVIRTEIGKVLNVTFSRFHLEGGGGTNCNWDWLQIHDGGDTTAPLFGKYCGESLAGTSIASTHDSFLLWFRSDHSTTGLGFSFSWNSTLPVCGGRVDNSSHGSISSPGYPGNYPSSRDCLWTLSVSLSKRISLSFANIGLETHPNCSFDYLEIRDGLLDTDPLLALFCNSTLPRPLTSSGPHVTIRFHSDASNSDIGFHLTYAEIEGVPGCGGVFTQSTGVISSPQHPEPYAHGLDCEYLIRLPSQDEKILLTFLNFELESGVNCRYDHVEIYDGGSRTSALVGRFCERNIPPSIRSSSNFLLVVFRSDASISFGGFRAKYETVCGGIYNDPNGILQSPYYPAPYPKNRECIYIIAQPLNKAIRMDFIEFDIEGRTPNNCPFDYLEIRDGDNENSTLIGHYCGGQNAAPPSIISSFNYLWLKFKTDGSIQNKGFLSNYTTIDISCGGILKESHGVIRSPGHPEIYPHGVDCVWIIRAIPGQVIRLNWVSFSLEQNQGCRYDSIEIYDNSTLITGNSRNGTLIGRYCGQESPPMLTSSDNTMTVRFRSDHSVAHDGFMANYVLINSTTVCGGNFYTQIGVLKSPNYPNFYPPGKICTWVVQIPVGQQIMLNVTDWDVENGTSQGCPYDALEIRNGGSVTSPLIGKYCGGDNKPPLLIPSSTNSLYLKFSTDASKSGRGFKILWDGTSTGCGSVLKGPSGSIVSPNYPVSAGTRIECIWTVNVNQGSAIQFMFVDLDLVRTSNCRSEYVELRDGSRANSPLLGRFCSSDSALAISTNSSSLRVKFLSTRQSTGRGFHATFQTICNRVIKGYGGVIESPSFPQPYPHERNCSWEIQVPLGNKINVSFSHFAIENPPRNECTYDYVQVMESSIKLRETPVSLGKYCGDTIPPPISSTKDRLFVNFVSDASFALNGFRLEWVINGCGGKIFGYGVLKSPGYPKPYANAQICEWVIETELGSKVSLTISELDLERSDACNFDSLSVFGGRDENSPLLTQLCHKTDKYVTVNSHGNFMFVRFKSDSSVTAKGFYGYVSQQPGGCGGIFTAPRGFIYSPNYPSNYDHDDDCSWLIRVDENHVVEFNFIDFNIERHINCSYDHVALYDGRSTNDPLLFLGCGDTIPDPPLFRSTGNALLVRLKTDGSSGGRGFKGNYSTGCGARLSGRGSLSSPSFPHPIFKLNCTWYLSGAEGERLTLTFTHLDIQSGTGTITGGECNRDYVQVIDGEDLDGPSVGKYCFNRIPPAITSSGKSLVVRVRTESSFGFGFRANYDSSNSACGGTLTATEGSFISPNFPNGYPLSSDCSWIIQASRGNRVSLSFSRVDIETSEFCNTDFVEVHENDASGPLLAHFCGNDIPTNITASERLWVLFRSDSEGQAPGFMAQYSLVHGVELSGSVGVVESPLYPFPNHLIGTYNWRIIVNSSRAIRFVFNDFDFGADTTTRECDNFLKIYDGYDESFSELFFSCDKNIPEPVITTGNVAYVSMVRGFAPIRSLFQLQWEEVSTELGANSSRLSNSTISGCGGTVELNALNNTSLLSPNYGIFPGYPPNLNCEWILNAPPSYRILLRFEDLDMESHTTCQYDRVELYDGELGLPNYVLNRTLCGRTEINNTYISSGRTAKVVLVTDATVPRLGFNITLMPICGGYVRESRGRITSPNYPLNYGHANCSWTVSVRPGRTISVSMTTLDIYKGPQQECSTDQLIIRNGGHRESPFLGQGRFCGNSIPIIPDTTGNQLFLRFTSWTAAGRGFDLSYSEVSVGCGGQIHLTENSPNFVFSTPNYPNIPPPFTECEWIFTVPQTESVQLDFQLTFQITYSSGCTKEGVEVRDGGTKLSPLIRNFCSEMPGTQKSSGNVLYVRYYTNINEPRSGFKAKASIASCGGTVVGSYGNIISPGYPVSYETNLDCLWTLRGHEGSFLNIDFTDLDIGPLRFSANASNASTCSQDYLLVTEENITDIETPRSWPFCGVSQVRYGSSRIVTSTNEVHVKFTTDSRRESRKGFKLNYRASSESCGGTLNSPSGVIQSLGYPTAYPHYRTCVWKIVAPPGRRVLLEFLDFDLEEKIITPRSTYCVDYITVTQSLRNSFGPALLMYNGSLCGTTLPPPVESTSNILTLRFRTDGSVAHRGFKAQFSTELPSICNEELSMIPGNISSPSIFTNTPNTTGGVVCYWKFNGLSTNISSSATLLITINSMNIRGNDLECTKGFLKLIPGREYSSYNWKKYCGSLSNTVLYLPGSSFELAYQSSDWESNFSLSYDISPCGGIQYGPNATLESPNYPYSYPINVDCIWVLSFRSGQIQLDFMGLDLDEHRDEGGECDRDYVVLRNGRYPSSPVLGRYCGNNPPSNSIISMSSDLWVEFHSDGTQNGNRRGIQIYATVLQQGCGGLIHNKVGTIRSPKTSRQITSYPNNAECEWLIETVPGYQLNFEYSGRFDIETSANCTNDFIEIWSKENDNWRSYGKTCGRQLPTAINTTSTQVKVLFRSNERTAGDGFALRWYSVCGGLYSSESGVIRSAHFDRYNHSYHVNSGSFWSYSRNENRYKVQQCDYTIKANSSNDYIVLEFMNPFSVSYRIEDSSDSTNNINCPFVNVTAWEGNNSLPSSDTNEVRRLGMYCGDDLPPTLIAKSILRLSYNYLPRLENYGFRAKFNIYSCGGEITTPTTIKSPGNPFTSAPNMNCTWIIKAPVGKVVRFKFKKLELEMSPICQFDYVKLFNGNWANEASKIGTFCGNLTEDIRRLTSNSNTMTLTYITDYSIHFSGFVGTVDFTIGPSNGCGGIINISSSSPYAFNSPIGSDGRYEPYLDCHWLFIGADYRVLELSFSQFSLQSKRVGGEISSDGCIYDWVEVRDGPGPSSELLGTYCGNRLPSTISSSTNFLWVNFVTDGSYQFSGFRANINSRPSPCGSSFSLNATKDVSMLLSPSFPNNYPSNLRCRWIVEGARLNDEVDISFVTLDIEPSPNCAKDRLQIRDISSSYTSPEGIGGPILFNGNQVVDWRFRNLNLDQDSLNQNFLYCGSQTPSDFISIGRSVEILFETDSDTTSRGFQIQYSAAGCNRTYEGSQGRILSPEWPTYSPIFTNCAKIVRVANGSSISLYFNSFEMDQSEGCTSSYFEVRERDQNGGVLAHLCGTALPDPIFSSSNILWINYITRLHPSRGFDISYTSSSSGRGCGGSLYNSGGTFTSPMYPGNSSIISDCQWRIRVPSRLKITLTFLNYMVIGDCAETYLEIYSISSHELDADPNLFTRFCPGDTPSNYNGNTDMAIVRYKSGLNTTGMGWKIKFSGRQGD